MSMNMAAAVPVVAKKISGPSSCPLLDLSSCASLSTEEGSPVESPTSFASLCSEDGEALPGIPRATPEDVGLDPRPFKALHERLKRAVASSKGEGDLPGLSYLVLRHGKLIASGSFGVTDEKSDLPWRFDTICRLFSMTKTVAVCAFMCLVEDGLVCLDDEVSKYLSSFSKDRLRVAVEGNPEGEPVQSEITIRHLLTHSSGLSYAPALDDEASCPAEESYMPLVERVDKGEVTNLQDWCDQLASVQLQFQPGSRWEYSYAIEVVGRIMEIASGCTLDELIFNRILKPLRMVDTGFSVSSAEASTGRIASFYRRGEQDRLKMIDSGSPDSCLWVKPQQQRVLSAGGAVGRISGGLVSTVNDFARLCLMIQNGGELEGVRVLKTETVQLMCQNWLPDVTGNQNSWCLDTTGLGFGVLGSVAVAHPEANWFDAPGEVGWGGLAGTAWAIDPKDGLVVISFCQVMYELWIDEEIRKAVRQSMGYSEERPTHGGASTKEVQTQQEREIERGNSKAELSVTSPSGLRADCMSNETLEDPDSNVCTPPARKEGSGKRPFESPSSHFGGLESPVQKMPRISEDRSLKCAATDVAILKNAGCMLEVSFIEVLPSPVRLHRPTCTSQFD